MDSDEHHRRLTRRVLEAEVPAVEIGEVSDASGLVAALDEARPGPRVVIADEALGWADGSSLLEQVKSRWPSCAAVLFTSSSLDPALAGGRVLRCDAVLRKDAAGWNALAPLVVELAAMPGAGHGAALGPGLTVAAADAARQETGAARTGTMHHEREEAGAATLDWFPELEAPPAPREAPPTPAAAQEAVHHLLPAVNLESAILTTMSQLKSLLRATRARVRAGPLPTLHLDRADAMLLCRNLIANGIEHAGGRAPVITVHAERREHYWLLSVHDNGAGIAARDVGEALHLIRPPGTPDEDEEGGGLAACARVARRYGGALWVQPRDGGGTSVYVALCTREASSTEDVSVTILYQGQDMGRISVSSLSDKQQIAGRALKLPRLRSALSERSIKDVVFVDADVVNVVA